VYGVLEFIKFFHVAPNLTLKFCRILLILLIFFLLEVKILHKGIDLVLQFLFVLFFHDGHLARVFFYRLFIIGLLLTVFFNFLLNLSPDCGVFVLLSLPLSAGRIDLVGDLVHLFLELHCHVRPFLFVDLQHFFVF
jgi:hypothetical protein